jgi:CBS domain-containing protein
MKVKDVMTQDVVTVRVGATLKQAAQLLVEHRISGLPVVDGEGTLLGIVSERDLLFKESGWVGDYPRYGRPGSPLASGGAGRVDAHLVGEAMTTLATTIEPERSVTAAARLMLEQDVNRLPVVEDGDLVGIVTRADLVRAFTRADAEIAREIAELAADKLRLDTRTIGVEVADGEVTLTGTIDSRADAARLPALVAQVPGVVDVRTDVRSWDDDPEC